MDIRFLLKNILIVITVIIFSITIINMLLYIGICISKKVSLSEKLSIRKNIDVPAYLSEIQFNNVFGTGYTNKSMIMFGCGIADGYYLEDKSTQSISAQLSKVFQRKVYDRSVLGGSIQQAIMQVQSHTIDDIIKESEYAMYFLPAINDSLALRTYPGDYFDTSFLFNPNIYPKYVENKDGKLVFHYSKHPIIEGSVLYRLIQKKLVTLLYSSNKQDTNLHSKQVEFLVKHFELLKDELHKINPNIKLVILHLYDAPSNTCSSFSLSLKNIGIEEVDLNTLLDIDVLSEEYRQNNNPTARLWEELAPAIKNEIEKK